MPAVTDPPSPKGLPTASTQSPTRTLLESPHFSTGSGCFGSTLRRARSVTMSRPADRRLERRVVGQDDGDLLGPGNDMIVGGDQSRGIDDEAGAEGVDGRALRSVA